MSNGQGLFGWIRDGVKQSVLLGVSDAIESIGTPEHGRELNPVLLSFTKQTNVNGIAREADETTARRLPGTVGRKRLGKSLRDIEPNKPMP
ncbi:MAG: hypothetical protein ABL921_08525 [Pirellula sp.]